MSMDKITRMCCDCKTDMHTNMYRVEIDSILQLIDKLRYVMGTSVQSRIYANSAKREVKIQASVAFEIYLSNHIASKLFH